MLELRAEEATFCVGCSSLAAEADGGAMGSIGDAAAEVEGAVVPGVDTEIEEERAFVDRVSEKLLVTVATW